MLLPGLYQGCFYAEFIYLTYKKRKIGFLSRAIQERLSLCYCLRYHLAEQEQRVMFPR